MAFQKRIEWLKNLNRRHSRQFCSTDAQTARRLYRARHKTKIFAFQCMDGRMNLAFVTETPLGIIKSYRSLGGIFDLGYDNLDNAFNDGIEYAIDNGQQSLIFATYHYSQSCESMGCAGFNFDRDKSIREAYIFKQQIERVYGKKHKVVCPIVCGLETDKDALILHGDNGKILDLSTAENDSREYLIPELRNLFRKMPQSILLDLLPLVQGNIRHIVEVKDRPIKEVEHKEDVLAIGRGFDWLYQPNIALIIGPYQLDLTKPIEKAASIIQLNMKEGRIPDDGFVLLTSAVYGSEAGTEIARAKERAMHMSNFAQNVIRECCHPIADKMHPLTVVMSLDTRRFKEVK
jgi:hypothetical protein